MTLARAIKLYKVSEQPHHALVPMEACDVAGVTTLLANYLNRSDNMHCVCESSVHGVCV